MQNGVLSTPPQFTPGSTPDERLKVEKDGLDVIHDLYRYAKEGFGAISEDDFNRLKWYGVYRQKPKDSGYFMLRTKIPGGQYDSRQLEVLSGIANDYAHGFCDITTRQTYQFHWLTIDQFPDIFRRLDEVGMTTSGACGDDTRNVVGCPIAGIDKNEVIDATPQLLALNQHFTDNREFSNLPRKYKISISGCRLHCAQPDINCVGLFGLEREKVGGGLEVGFGMKIGGGLSSAPHLAQVLPVFLKPEEVLEAVHFTSVVFRDYGFREKRTRARYKFLVAEWGVERVLEKMEELAGKKWERHEEFHWPQDPETDHLGVTEQKQPGLFCVGVSFPGGRLRYSQLVKIAELSRKYAVPGLDRIVNTNKQNLILLHIPEARVSDLQKELQDHGLVWDPSNFRQGCVSCTGIEFCNLAIAETKNRMIHLVDQLEEECREYQDKIRIHFSGCPSSCGQHQIADIGLRGGKTRVDGEMKECFDLFIGGKLGEDARFNQLLTKRVMYDDIHHVIGKLLKYYQANQLPEEKFHQFASRIPREELQGALQ